MSLLNEASDILLPMDFGNCFRKFEGLLDCFFYKLVYYQVFYMACINYYISQKYYL